MVVSTLHLSLISSSRHLVTALFLSPFTKEETDYQNVNSMQADNFPGMSTAIPSAWHMTMLSSY